MELLREFFYLEMYHTLRGPGGLDLGMGKIEFDTVSDREKCKLSDAFFGIKK